MAAEVTKEVKKRLGYACRAGDLLTLRRILSDHPDSIHDKIGNRGNIILTLKNSNHNYLALRKHNCLSIHNLSIYYLSIHNLSIYLLSIHNLFIYS